MSIPTAFSDLGLSEGLLKAIEAKGFEEPSPIQAQVIPLLLNGDKDIVGQAQTGTGKTAAFGLPVIEQLSPDSKHVQAIVLTPTRELALQVAEELNSLRGKKNLSIMPIYGGQSISLQLRRLRGKVDIVVGTPGRVMDHLQRGSLKLNDITHMILDEADEMLNMGFVEDIEKIIQATNPDRRMLLFSATMPKPILRIAEKYMKAYDIIRVQKEELTTSLTDQIYYEVSQQDKFEALCRIIDIENDFYSIVFCRTKRNVDLLTHKLQDRGYDAEGIHGDISQHQRERVLKKFKDRRCSILVATDVAARGIDVENVSHVINYALPQDPEAYVHRIGRTGRAGNQGTAITFVTPSEYRQLIFIKRIAKSEIRKEKLPGVDQIIMLKKQQIVGKIDAILDLEAKEEYVAMAEELLTKAQPQHVIAALIQHSFADELSNKSYKEIKDVSGKISLPGTTRLFIAKGRNDDITPQSLLEFVKNEVDIDPQHIQDIRILESFSFITVPFEDAEILLHTFKKKSKGSRPLVTRARDKNSSSGPRRSYGGKPRSSSRGSYSSRPPRRTGGYGR